MTEDVPGGSERGGHAHRQVREFLVAISGSFDVVLDDGRIKQRFHCQLNYADDINVIAVTPIGNTLIENHYGRATYGPDIQDIPCLPQTIEPRRVPSSITGAHITAVGGSCNRAPTPDCRSSG